MTIKKEYKPDYHLVYGSVIQLIHQKKLTSVTVNTGLPYPETYTIGEITFNVVNNNQQDISFSDGIEQITFE
jgi:type IV secretory pathway ATPase VirB11/archaellum biosynthesis ATPase